MLGWPGSDWVEGEPQEAPPLAADWQEDPRLEVRHTFTHFHLRLALRLATVVDTIPDRGAFIPLGAFRPATCPR